MSTDSPQGLPSDPLPPDESRGYILNIVCWLGVAISTIFVILRLYSRKYITRTLGWSDGIIVVAQILQIASTSLASVAISYGVGRHLVYIPAEDIEPVLYYSNILQPVGIPAFWLPKISVALLIVSLMGPEKRGAWFLYATVAIVCLTSTLSAIMLFAQCNPPNHAWHPMEPAKCLPGSVLVTIGYVAGAWAAFADLILAAFPAFLLRNVQLKRSKKIKIIIIMGLGFFATIASVVKTTQLSQNRSKDASYDLFWLILTTYIETDIVIIAACAPTLPKLFTRLFYKDTDSSTSTRRAYGSRSVSRGYQAFDSENKGSIAMDVMQGKVVITSHTQVRD